MVVHRLNDIKVSDGDIVAPALIPRALTAGEPVFSDHATQVFKAVGGTTYVESGRHFPAWEQAELFTQELRAAFKPLRASMAEAS